MAGFQNHHAGSIAEGIAIRNAKRAENIARHDAIDTEGFTLDPIRLEEIFARWDNATKVDDIPSILHTSPWDTTATWDDHDMVDGGGTWEDCENPF